MIKTHKFGGWLAVLATVVLTACGGPDSSNFANNGSGTTSSGGTTSSSSSGGTTGTVTALTLVSSTSSMPSDGSAAATITAYVRDANNALLENVPVSFSATSGGITPASATSSIAGAASATLSTAGDATLRTISVTATAGSKTATVNVQVVSASSSTTVQLGSGTGSGFMPNVIGISNNNLSAGGSTTLTVSLVQSDGTLYTQSTAINFSSTCIASGNATIYPSGQSTPSTTVTTATGIATVTYVAKGCAGSDVITASATVGATNVSATGSVTVAQAAVGSLAFVSATPTNIALKGMGVTGRPESATVIFQVLDTSGGARQGATVNFSLDTTVGGISLQPSSASAVSDVNGNAQIVVNAGTVATAVRVTASTTLASGTVISTQSSVLTITTGIPTANNFSMAVGCGNIEGYDVDGVTTTVTARLSDRFQNPVPDGTAVTFHAKAGAIGAECTTATTSTEGGLCSVTYRSSGNRPTGTNGSGVSLAGLVPLLATAIGEESFNDANGNGYFDVGETFTDTSEPFENDAWLYTGGKPIYSAGDPSGADWFYDFNDNGMHDGPDGFFNGVLCNDTARCAGPHSAGIGAMSTIILSGSNATITDPSGAALSFPGTGLTENSTGSITAWIRDENNNIMPGGTTVTAATSGTALTLSPSAAVTVPCINAGGGYAPGLQQNTYTLFTWLYTVPSNSGGGIFTISVATPGKVTTQLGVSYKVN